MSVELKFNSPDEYEKAMRVYGDLLSELNYKPPPSCTVLFVRDEHAEEVERRLGEQGLSYRRITNEI